MIQEAMAHNKHISDYKFDGEQTWAAFRNRAAGRDVYLYGLGNAAGYFIEKYSDKVKLCGAIDSYIGLQGFCLGDYLPEAVETACERISIYDAGILPSLDPEKTIILITAVNAYEEIAREMASYRLQCFVLLLMEADARICFQDEDARAYDGKQIDGKQIGKHTAKHNAKHTAKCTGEQPDLQEQRNAYTDKCCSLPIAENKIVCMIGRYGGHARYITKELIRQSDIGERNANKAGSGKAGDREADSNHRVDLDIVWLVEDLRMKVPEGVRPVLIGNWKKYIYEMETAGIWVFDILVPAFIRKREGQIYIQTKHWPSITLKKFFLDDPSTTDTEYARQLVRQNGKIADYFLVGSDFDLQTCKSGFACEGAFVFVGSPRTDALFAKGNGCNIDNENRTNSVNRNKVYARYHIAADIHTLLYAPTFRFDQEKKQKRTVQGLDFTKLLKQLERRFGGQWKILFRGHPSLLHLKNREDRAHNVSVIDVSGYEDSQELVAACDILISDYSSILFEAAFVGKAALLFAPDREAYLEKERTFYIDYDALPFPAAQTNEELAAAIERFDEGACRKKTALFLEQYGVHEDGHASERAAAFLLSRLERRHRISVIIPFYNTAAYLPRCIESVLNQSCRDLEIILVDDGSTDDSLQICEAYAKKDPRIVLISQENRGNTAARKAGVKACRGEYVMFVDSDDWIGTDLAALLYEQAQKHRADLVVSNVLKIRAGGREEERRNLIAPGVYTNPGDAVKKLFFDYEDCRYGILPYLFAKLYRRELAVRSMEKIDDRIQYDEDRALVWTCLMQDITAVFVDSRAYYYCQRAEGLVRARDELYLAKINYFYCYMRRLFAQEDGILRKQLERYVAWNVQIAFQWKLGMGEGVLPKAQGNGGESRPDDHRKSPDSRKRPVSGSEMNAAGVPDPAGHNVKVSVIIPSLNAAGQIRECLDSVRRQTLPELEILCVDAGSTDGTAAILEEYAALDNRIRYLQSERKSYGFQMNAGIEAAGGEYIGIVEPDDYVAEDMFEKLYDAAHGNRLDYVKSNFYKFVDYRGRRHYRKWERSYWGQSGDIFGRVILLKETPRALVYGDHGNIWSGIYRREFVLERKIRFHETPGASYQDTGFALLCSLEAERVMFVEDCFYRYRQGGTGASVRSQDKHSVIIAEYAWIWEQMKSRGLTDEVCRSFYMVMKFHSYLWNYNRLRPEGRRRFLAGLVQDEMLEFREEVLAFRIPEKDRMLRLWRGNQTQEDIFNEAEERRRNDTEAFLQLVEKASQIVVVCAGARGRALLKLCGKLGTGNIRAICDNAPAVQRQTVEGMAVLSVERAVRQYPKACYMIANQCHAEELSAQLVGAGISAEQISVYGEGIYGEEAVMKFLFS